MHQLRRLASHRLIAVLTATLLLVEVGLVVHQVDHQFRPDHSHCALCLLADHFGSAALGTEPSVAASVCHEQPAATVVRFRPTAVPAFFQARAPPLLSLSS